MMAVKATLNLQYKESSLAIQNTVYGLLLTHHSSQLQTPLEHEIQYERSINLKLERTHIRFSKLTRYYVS